MLSGVPFFVRICMIPVPCQSIPAIAAMYGGLHARGVRCHDRAINGTSDLKVGRSLFSRFGGAILMMCEFCLSHIHKIDIRHAATDEFSGGACTLFGQI